MAQIERKIYSSKLSNLIEFIAAKPIIACTLTVVVVTLEVELDGLIVEIMPQKVLL